MNLNRKSKLRVVLKNVWTGAGLFDLLLLFAVDGFDGQNIMGDWAAGGFHDLPRKIGTFLGWFTQ